MHSPAVDANRGSASTVRQSPVTQTAHPCVRHDSVVTGQGGGSLKEARTCWDSGLLASARYPVPNKHRRTNSGSLMSASNSNDIAVANAWWRHSGSPIDNGGHTEQEVVKSHCSHTLAVP